RAKNPVRIAAVVRGCQDVRSQQRGINLCPSAARGAAMRLLVPLFLRGLCTILGGAEIPALVEAVATPRFRIYPGSLGSGPERRVDVAEIADVGGVLDPPLIDRDVAYDVVKGDDRMDSGRIFWRRNDHPSGILRPVDDDTFAARQFYSCGNRPVRNVVIPAVVVCPEIQFGGIGAGRIVRLCL